MYTLMKPVGAGALGAEFPLGGEHGPSSQHLPQPPSSEGGPLDSERTVLRHVKQILDRLCRFDGYRTLWPMLGLNFVQVSHVLNIHDNDEMAVKSTKIV